MPMIDADGCLINVSVEGRDGGPTLMLSNSLGCTLQMWEPQMKALTQVFRVIRYDRRGHGSYSEIHPIRPIDYPTRLSYHAANDYLSSVLEGYS